MSNSLMRAGSVHEHGLHTSSIIHRASRFCLGSSALSTRWPSCILGALTVLALPQLAMADMPEGTFVDPSAFQSELQYILTHGSGESYLTYAGASGQVLVLTESVSAPGSSDFLTIDLGASELHINSGVTSITHGTSLNLGMDGGTTALKLGSTNQTGELHIAGGEVNFGGTGATNPVMIGYYENDTGILRITDGGKLKLGMESTASSYTGFYGGYQGGTAQIILDNASSIEIGSQGASMRFGIRADASIEIRNGSIIDSSRAASHFRVGEGIGGSATVTVDNSSIVIKGGGTNAGIDDRYFVIGYGGGTGIFNQNGDEAYVHASGLALVGIGRGDDSYGEYNLNGGLLEVGREGLATEFQVGVGETTSNPTAIFNVNGGEARLWGDLKIAGYGGNATVNVSGGEMNVGDEIVFGKGIGTFNLANGEVAARRIFFRDMGTSTINVSGGTLKLTEDIAFDAGTRTINVNGGSFAVGDRITFGAGNGTINVNGGTLAVGDRITFGAGNGTINLDGGVLAAGGVIASTTNSRFTFNGGTLRALSDLELRHDASIGTNGATFDSNGQTLTVSRTLSGEGQVVKLGEGFLVLSGANTYQGGTLIQAGVVEVTNVAGLGTGSVTLDGGTLRLFAAPFVTNAIVAGQSGGTIDLSGQVVTFSGGGSGTGNVTFRNGSVQLNSSVGWSGETILESGTILTPIANDVLSPDSLLRLNEGSFYLHQFNQSVAGLAGDGVLLISPLESNLTVGANNTTSTFNGTIIGFGTLTKAGTGRLNLTSNGPALFNGSMVVENGLLSVNGNFEQAAIVIGANGRLDGNGTVASIRSALDQSGGVIAPGNGIGMLNVQGDVDFAGLTYEAELDEQRNSDLLNISGRASLTGGTLRILSGSDVLPDMSYTVLRAESIDGTFDRVLNDLVFMDATVLFDDDRQVSVLLERNEVDYESVGKTQNQKSVGRAIGTTEGNSALQKAILQLGEDEAAAAFDILSGEIHASAKTALVEDTRRIRDAVNARLLADLSRPGGETGYNLWALGFGAGGSLAGSGNADKLDRSSGGLLAGVDTGFDGWTVGALAGYGHSSFHADARASAGSADTFHVGVYGGNRWNGGLGVRGGLAYAHSRLDTSRTVGLRGLGDTLSADYDAGAVHAFGEIGYELDVAGTTIEPFANLAHVHLRTDGYTETGGEGALRASAQTMDTTFVTVGAHASSEVKVAGVKVKARGTVGWQHAAGDIDPTATHRFSTGDAFTVTGTPVARDMAVVKAGLDLELTPDATLSLSYDGAFGSGSSVNSGTVGLKVRF